MQLITAFTTRTLIIIVIGASFAILGNMLAYVIVGQINQRVLDKEQFSYLWWDLRIRKKHKQLYPGSKLVLLFDLCGILMVLCFPFLIWSMGIWNSSSAK
jgi:hypothetical protein